MKQVTERQAKRNIRLLQIFRALGSALFAMPVIVLFFQENGLSQTEIFILQSAFAVAVLLLEVPSGYFADKIGRRTSLTVGALLGAIGFGIYAISYGFWPILCAEIFLGIALSFISGADSALAYDTLCAVGKEKRYRKFESNAFAFAGVASAIASIVGGLMAGVSLRTVVALQIPVYILMAVVTLMIIEPNKHKVKSGRSAIKDVIKVTKYALHGHKEVKWLIFYAAVVGTMTHTMVWLTQPYYQMVGVPLSWFGLLWAGQFLLVAVLAQLADWYEKFGRSRVLTSFVLIGLVDYILIGLTPNLWIVPLMIIGFAFVRAIFTPIIRDYVNRLIESNIRATVLSVQSLAQKVLYIGAGPLIGWVMDMWSLPTALLFSGIFYGTLGSIVLIMMKRSKLL